MYGELPGRILSLLFPYQCIYCGDIAHYKEAACDDCLEKLAQTQIGLRVHSLSCGTPCFAAAVCALEYSGNVRRAVAQLKFYGRKDSAPHLAGLMVQAWRLHMDGTAIDGVVPVPMHPKRLKKRGYNQAQLLAKETAAQLAVPCMPGALIKTRDNALQHELHAEERLANIRDVFAVAGGITYEGKHILLVDDVLTTGATVNECAHQLLEAGAERVYVLTFAAAP